MSDQGFDVDLSVVTTGWDGISFWVHSRAGIVPGAGHTLPNGTGRSPSVVLTANKWLFVGSDVFYDINDFRTDDLGDTWSIPFRQAGLGRRKAPEDPMIDVAVSDFQPRWHAATGKLLGTGHTVRYSDDKLVRQPRPRETAYSIYDPEKATWSRWQMLELPVRREFRFCGAGSTQRYDLPDGTILLPVSFQRSTDSGSANAATTVLWCDFDGTNLRYRRHGTELTTDVPRGFGEGALTRFGERFFLTLRNDEAGYVCTSDDGLTFLPPVEWTFDDGTPLGNYNTQQKWVTHSDGLYLVYTRRGADNDHVFRHRAPLFIAQVDPDRLCVIRDTERVLVPERGARLGNFGVTDVSQEQTWVTVAEVMAPDPHCSKYGADNAIFVAKIRWSTPNELFSA